MNIILYVDLMLDGLWVRGRSNIGATSSDIVATSSNIIATSSNIVATSSNIVVTSSCNSSHFPVGCCADLKIVVLDVDFSLSIDLNVYFSLSTWLNVDSSLSFGLDVDFSLSTRMMLELVASSLETSIQGAAWVVTCRMRLVLDNLRLVLDEIPW